jgi:polyphenol oxidase
MRLGPASSAWRIAARSDRALVIPSASEGTALHKSDLPVIPEDHLERVADFDEFGVRAFTTTRQFGTLGSGGADPIHEVMGRWDALRASLARDGVTRLATASQVHAAHVVTHQRGWEGWLRGNQADGHFAPERGTALAVTIADCVPVFIAHPSGAAATLHSGWRGTVQRIVEQGIRSFAAAGLPAAELRIHLGPAICGSCYEVSPEVIARLTGRSVSAPETVDLREIIASHARAAGVRQVTSSTWCTRHHNERFFSHRAGDAGRQIGVIYARRS